MDRKIKGFTLIELLIIIAIISILMAVIYRPISQKIEEIKVEGEVKKIYGLLEEGRMIAFTQKKDLQFELSGNQACLKENNNQLKCINLEKPFSSVTVDITNRGTFGEKISIFYTGPVKVLTTDCIVISYTRVKLGVKDENGNCNAK